MTQIVIPSQSAKVGVRRLPRSVVVVAGLVLIVGVVWALARALNGSGPSQSSYKTVPVRQGPFEVRVDVSGDLQAVDNIDVICEVEGTTTITQLIPEGATVRQGDVLVTLDSSQARQRLEDASIDLQRITADVTTASEIVEIQKSQNAANVQADSVALELAQISLRSYNEGLWPQMLADAKMSNEKADVGLTTKLDELQQTRTLFAKGFVTATEVRNKETEVASARRDVEKAQTDLRVLVDFSHLADLTAKRNTLAQAEQKLARTKRENASNLSQRTADFAAKSQQLSVIQRRVERFTKQVENTIIRAPAEGLVVYNNQRNNDQPPIQEGSQVRERQTILRLPDTSRMKVVFKANENQVGRIRLYQLATIAIANYATPVTGWMSKISPISDSSGRWWDPDRKEYPVDIMLDWTPDGLKPGMGVKASILVDRVDNAMSIPIGSVYTAGEQRYAFVPTDNAARPMPIRTGRTNDTDIEILEGLTPDTNVILLEAGQGKLLLERAGVGAGEDKGATRKPS